MSTDLLSFARKFVVILGLVVLNSCGGGGGGSPGTNEPITLVAVGDSITGTTFYGDGFPYPTHLAAAHPNYTVINQGRSNERSSGGAAKINGVLARYNPDVLVIYYGIVDVINRDTVNTPENIRFMIQAGKASGAKVIVCNLPDLYGSRAGNNAQALITSNQITAVAREESVALVNLRAEMAGSPELYPDGLHPNRDGHRIIAVAIDEKI